MLHDLGASEGNCLVDASRNALPSPGFLDVGFPVLLLLCGFGHSFGGVGQALLQLLELRQGFAEVVLETNASVDVAQAPGRDVRHSLQPDLDRTGFVRRDIEWAREPGKFRVYERDLFRRLLQALDQLFSFTVTGLQVTGSSHRGFQIEQAATKVDEAVTAVFEFLPLLRH